MVPSGLYCFVAECPRREVEKTREVVWYDVAELVAVAVIFDARHDLVNRNL